MYVACLYKVTKQTGSKDKVGLITQTQILDSCLRQRHSQNTVSDFFSAESYDFAKVKIKETLV